VTIDERLVAAGLPPLPRRAWLEIDEEALRNNVTVFRELIGPNVEFMAVVKADAYGHGLVPVARVLERQGVTTLCVATLDEGIALRRSGIAANVLVLYPIPGNRLSDANNNRIEISVTGNRSLEDMDGGSATTEVGVETGLSRDGVLPTDVPEAIRRAHPLAVWSHLATPEDAATTAAQVSEFERGIELAKLAGVFDGMTRHIAATGGVLTGHAPVYDGVRVGIGLYGIVPPELVVPDHIRPFADRLRPVMALKAQPIRVQSFPAGTKVGYGGTWVAPRESVIATLPVGYGDGFARAYQPGGQALVRGRRVPLVGTVAMDAVMVDVTEIDGADLDDGFVLLGSQGSDSIDANELARLRNTNPWEVVTTMSFRLPRVYHAASVLKGLRTLDGEVRARAEAVG
jgi:alanine racemase